MHRYLITVDGQDFIECAQKTEAEHWFNEMLDKAEFDWCDCKLVDCKTGSTLRHARPGE